MHERISVSMQKNKATALITGGNGNLGCLVADRLIELGQKVVKFDIPGTETVSHRENEVIVIGDIRDAGLIAETISTHQIDTIYHLASLLSGSSEANLIDAWEINATASLKLMNLAVEAGVEKFFFASTFATYSEVRLNPMPQDFPQWPENMYGVTKVAVERLGVYFKSKHGLDFRCLRFPLVISPNAPRTAVTAFPSHAFKAARAGQKFIFPVSENTGVSTIFLDDVVDSIVKFTDTDPARLTQHAYSLHAYYLSAGLVIDAIKQRFPGFEYGFEPIENVEQLLSGWPDVIDDQIARIDWGWAPAFDLPRSADRMVELLTGAENG